MATVLDLSGDGPRRVPGPAGAIEMWVDQPRRACVGAAIVAHPQPLLGGHARHKLPQFLAHGLAGAGWLVLRPNFRGVGQTQGAHDGGRGETDDLLSLAMALQAEAPPRRLALVGFSFGAFVQAGVARRLADRGRPAWRVFLAGLPHGEVEGGRHYDTPGGLPDARVVHGGSDERVPLRSVLDWARPHVQPIVVLPGADHFFTGKLPALRTLLLDHLRA